MRRGEGYGKRGESGLASSTRKKNYGLTFSFLWILCGFWQNFSAAAAVAIQTFAAADDIQVELFADSTIA